MVEFDGRFDGQCLPKLSHILGQRCGWHVISICVRMLTYGRRPGNVTSGPILAEALIT